MTKENGTAILPAERPVRLRNIIGFGIGDIYGGGAFLIVGMLFMFFLTEVVGLRPALAGLMFGAGKIWDGISDPLMGYLSDRTTSNSSGASYPLQSPSPSCGYLSGAAVRPCSSSTTCWPTYSWTRLSRW